MWSNKSLLRTKSLRDEGGIGEPTAADAVLRDAVAVLAGQPRDDKLRSAVDRTSLRSAATQQGATAVLGLSCSIYRRHLTQGLVYRQGCPQAHHSVYSPDHP